MTGEKKRFLNKSILIIDVLMVIIAYAFAYYIRNTFFAVKYGSISIYNSTELLWVLAIACVTIPIIMEISGIYSDITQNKLITVIIKTFICVGFSVLSITAVLYFGKQINLSRLFFGIFALTIFLFLVIERVIFDTLLRMYFRNTRSKTNILVIGTNSLAEKYTKYINENKTTMVNIVGYVNAGEGHYSIGFKLLGDLCDLDAILKDNLIDEVVFALPRDYYGELESYIYLCEEKGLVVNMLLDFFDLNINKTRLGTFGNLPVVTFSTLSAKYWQLLLKRIIDITGAIVGLAITAIAFLVVAPAIVLESPGPIFFSQDRMGKHGRIFKCYKFRSMYANAEERKEELISHNEMKGNMFKIKDDPRITKVGKIIRSMSIDELPQFWNVLKGDMSLVGTRPPTMDEVEKYKNHHWKRLCIKPGITGLWQVSGRNEVKDFEDVIKLDNVYIENWSIKLDIQLLLKTFKVVLMKSGS